MILSLQSLRFIFTLLVFFSHILGKEFDFGGECGVSFFFILSGFVLSKSYGQKIADGSFCSRQFFVKQFLKLYPLHIITMLICLLLDARLGVFAEWYKILLSALLLQSWIPYDEFYFVANGLSWFLCDIMFFYYMFIHIYKRVSLCYINRTLPISILVVIIAYFPIASLVPAGFVNSVLYASPLTRIIDFTLGVALYKIYESQPSKRVIGKLRLLNRTHTTMLEVLIMVALACSFFIYQSMEPRYRCAGLFWFIIPIVIYFFTAIDFRGGVLTSLLHSDILLRLGSISFEFYMIHCIVIRIVNSLFIHVGIAPELLYTTIVSLLATTIISFPVRIYIVDKASTYLKTLTRNECKNHRAS